MSKVRAVICAGLFILSALLLAASPAFSAQANHLVISEVCVGHLYLVRAHKGTETQKVLKTLTISK